MPELEGVRIPVRPDAEGFGRELQAQINPQLQAATQQWQQLLRRGLAAAGVFGAATEIKRSVNLASDLSENLNVTRLTFDEATEAAIRFGKEGSAAIGMSASTALEQQARLGGMIKNMGIAASDAQMYAERLVKLSADIGSAFNKSAEEVSFAISAGLRGEQESLRRFNVFLSQEAVVDEAISSGLIKSKNEMDQRVKALATMQLIMKQTTDVAGDFGNTVEESLPNQLKVMRAELDTARISLGDELLPATLELIKTFREAGIPAIQSFAEAIGPALGSGMQLTLPLLKAAGPAIQVIADALNAIPTPVLTMLGAGWALNRYSRNGALGMFLPGFAASGINSMRGVGMMAPGMMGAGMMAPGMAGAGMAGAGMMGAAAAVTMRAQDDLARATVDQAAAATQVAAAERVAATQRVTASQRVVAASQRAASAHEAAAAAAGQTSLFAPGLPRYRPTDGVQQLLPFPQPLSNPLPGSVVPTLTQQRWDFQQRPSATWSRLTGWVPSGAQISQFAGRYAAPAAVLGGSLLAGMAPDNALAQAGSSGLMFGGMAALMGAPMAALAPIGILAGGLSYASSTAQRNASNRDSAASNITAILAPYAAELNALPPDKRQRRIAQILQQDGGLLGSYWADYQNVQGLVAGGMAGRGYTQDNVLDVAANWFTDTMTGTNTNYGELERFEAIQQGITGAGVRLGALTAQDRYGGTGYNVLDEMLGQVTGLTSDRVKADALRAIGSELVLDEAQMQSVVEAVVGNPQAYAAAAETRGEAFKVAWQAHVEGVGAAMVAEWRAEIEAELATRTREDRAMQALQTYAEVETPITVSRDEDGDGRPEDVPQTLYEVMADIERITPEIQAKMSEAFNFTDWETTGPEAQLRSALDGMQQAVQANVDEMAAKFEAAPSIETWLDWQESIDDANEFRDTTLTNLETVGVQGIDVLRERWQAVVDAPDAELDVYITGGMSAQLQAHLRWLSTLTHLDDLPGATAPASAEGYKTVWVAPTAHTPGGYYTVPVDEEGYAWGGIIDRPTLTWVGEGGDREVIIPLTKPGRAMQLARESGLIDLLVAQSGGGMDGSGLAQVVDTHLSRVGGRQVTIQNLTVTAPDADAFLMDLDRTTEW